MISKPSLVAVLALFLPFLPSQAQEPSSEERLHAIPYGTYPGYEETKQRVNQGLGEPTTVDYRQAPQVNGAVPDRCL